MASSTSHPAGNVAAAAALQFSVDFDPSRSDSQPSVLLFTQNVGGIEAAFGGVKGLLDASPGMSPASEQLTSGASFPSAVAAMVAPSYASVPDDPNAELGVPAEVRQQVADFLADLRTWLHRMSYISAAARRSEKTAGQAASATATASTSSSPPPPYTRHTASPSGTHTTAEQTAESLLQGYSAASRPPLVDVVVIHFQEIGGKYKNKQFNKYFREQLSAVLLPEAGWTSGLLMDERESDRAVVSSNAVRPTCAKVATAAAAAMGGSGSVGQNASPTSSIDRLRGSPWGCKDSQSHRSSNDVSGAETDVSEEEADPFFTAIGSIVFLSPRVMGITSCLSVPHRTYIPIVDDPKTYAGDAGRLFLARKFSQARRSRKGFLMVSLRIGTVQFNVCNLHLFNDDDNRVAFEQSPSTYTGWRIRAVQEAFAECSAVIDFEEPLFLFGDYNVRMDGKAFVQWAEEKERISIRPGKKQLRCPEHLWTFFSDPARVAELRRAFDGELQRLTDEVAVQAKVELGEMPVLFAPTYSRVPYHQRGETASNNNNAGAVPMTTTSAAGLVESSLSAAPTSGGRNAQRSEASPQQPALQEPDALNRTQTPATATNGHNTASSSKSPLLPQSSLALTAVAAVEEPLSHVVADATRDNFSHDRLPAWCDRVLFNVAGLEWISGDRARPLPSTTTGSSSTAARDRRRTEATPSPPPPRWYVYDAIDFVHMDHDGVFLMF